MWENDMKRFALPILLLLPWPVYAQDAPPAVQFAITAQIVPAPEPTPAPPILIDGVEAAPVGSLIYLEAKTADAKPCAWACVPDNGNFRVVDGGRAAVFCSGSNGVWTFIAAANSESGPPLLASHVITIGEPTPVPPPVPPPPIPPTPDPPVPPTPPAGPRWVIILEETAERPAPLAAIIASPLLRDYLSQNKHHPLRLGDPGPNPPAWVTAYLEYLARPEIAQKLPALVITADPTAGSSGAKVLYVGPVPATAEAVIAELKRRGG